jgi:hypothetical protein
LDTNFDRNIFFLEFGFEVLIIRAVTVGGQTGRGRFLVFSVAELLRCRNNYVSHFVVALIFSKDRKGMKSIKYL